MFLERYHPVFSHKTAVNIIGNVVIDPVVFQKKLKVWNDLI
jgi:hypothetical protein